MMRRDLRRKIMAGCLALLPLVAAHAATTYEEGKHFQRVPDSVKSSPIVKMNDSKGKVTVTEFFSYGCPGCNAVAKPLTDWAHQQSDNVELNRVPVEFFKGWDVYAKAYYTAEILGVLDKINLPLFNAIHKDRQDLGSKEALQRFFVAHGVKAEDFDKTYDSFAVNRSLERGKMLMRTYRVFAVPTLIVDNQYQTDLQQTKGAEGFIKVLQQLVDKVKAG